MGDLNRDPGLPLDEASLDGACSCVSVQDFERPVEVMREMRHGPKAGSPLVVTFSDRFAPTKAVMIWQERDLDRVDLVSRSIARAAFSTMEAQPVQRRDRGGNPLWAVAGWAPAGAT